jgi:hypothetical protein
LQHYSASPRPAFLLVNVALKDHWGRPRPIDIAQLGGTEHFVPWWN